jgi:mRNA-degrading endonuclease RelE of RelBE toxin-antitoxin system
MVGRRCRAAPSSLLRTAREAICNRLDAAAGAGRNRGAMQPFQIIFNPTSAGELSRLPKELQLHILGQFRGLPQELQREEGHFGHLARAGRSLTRYRLGDYRVYFERHPLGVVVHRILSKNSLKDFLFRSSLPTGEDEQLQDNPKFWDLIEQARSPGAAAK